MQVAVNLQHRKDIKAQIHQRFVQDRVFQVESVIVLVEMLFLVVLNVLLCAPLILCHFIMLLCGPLSFCWRGLGFDCNLYFI